MFKNSKYMKKLWQSTINLNQLVEEYTSGDDVLLDQNLINFDIYGSLAHAQMLQKQNLIEEKDLNNIRKGLIEILNKYQSGKYFLALGDEDVHTKVENDLTQEFPESGAKLHTGRSRNDQVLVDIRLYTKTKLIEIALETIDAIQSFLNKANQLAEQPMLGMTHMQPAMLSSFGLWLGAFAESLIDDLSLLETAYQLNDQSPLGSGAAYGVTLPLDREYTAKLLGFSKVQNNALYCQNSRGKIESATLHSLSQIMATLNKFATDSLLFTTEPFSFISFDKALGTGSSIMPQKQNWDALELMRAKYHQVATIQMQFSNSSVGLPSGYNRDLQQAKGGLFTAMSTTLSSLQIVELFVDSMVVNKKAVEKHLPKEIFAAHWAYVLMKEQGLPFRQAYLYVKDHLADIPNFKPGEVLSLAISQGSTGDLRLKEIEGALKKKKTEWIAKKSKFEKTINALIK